MRKWNKPAVTLEKGSPEFSTETMAYPFEPYARTRKTKGNALSQGTRSWFMGHRFDDCSDRGISRSEIDREQQELTAINNTQFRKAFIDFYGKDWWDDCMSGH